MSDLTPAWIDNQYERLESLLRMKQLFIEKKIKNWAKSNELYFDANTDKSIYHFYLNDGSVNEILEPKKKRIGFASCLNVTCMTHTTLRTVSIRFITMFCSSNIRRRIIDSIQSPNTPKLQ